MEVASNGDPDATMTSSDVSLTIQRTTASSILLPRSRVTLVERIDT